MMGAPDGEDAGMVVRNPKDHGIAVSMSSAETGSLKIAYKAISNGSMEWMVNFKTIDNDLPQNGKDFLVDTAMAICHGGPRPSHNYLWNLYHRVTV